jgi:hypothetical protein
VRLEESSWAWLSDATRDASLQAEFYEYQYSLDSKDVSVWQALNDSGDDLLNLPLTLESQAQVLISHPL